MHLTSALMATTLAVAGLSNVVETIRPAESPRPDDAAILGILEFIHSAAIETGELAQEQGASQEVKDMGRNFVAAHTQARDEARELAHKLRLTPKLPPTDSSARAHADALTRLRGLEGKAFDRAFIEHQVEFHQGVVEEVKTVLIPSAARPELKAYLNRIAPAVQAHLEEARALQTRIVALSRTPRSP